MDKYFVAYIDKNRGLQSAIIADFDADDLSGENMEQLSLCINGNDCGGMLEDVRLNHVYLAIDFNDRPPYIAIDEKYDQEDGWWIETSQVYDNFESAKKAFLEEAGHSGDYKKAVIKVLFE